MCAKRRKKYNSESWQPCLSNNYSRQVIIVCDKVSGFVDYLLESNSEMVSFTEHHLSLILSEDSKLMLLCQTKLRWFINFKHKTLLMNLVECWLCVKWGSRFIQPYFIYIFFHNVFIFFSLWISGFKAVYTFVWKFLLSVSFKPE